MLPSTFLGSRHWIVIYVHIYLPFSFSFSQHSAWSLKLSDEIKFSPVISTLPIPRYFYFFGIIQSYHMALSSAIRLKTWKQYGTGRRRIHAIKMVEEAKYPATSHWPVEAEGRTRHVLMHPNQYFSRLIFFLSPTTLGFLAQRVGD